MIQWGVIRYWLLIPLLSVGAASSRTTQNYFHSIKDRRLGKTYPPTAATVPYQSSSCVTDVAGLLSAVRSLSSGTNNSSTILVCAESIIFSDATGKNINASLILASSNTYDFQCTLPSPQRCVWDGKNITRFLYGINVVVTFTRFDFVDGSSRQDTTYDETAGGALYFKKSTLTLNDCRFFGNKADFGGAIFLQESVLYLKGPNLFQNNSARISGGAIYLEESSRLLSTSALTEFKLNRAMFASAIRGSENSSIDLKRASFVENRAWDFATAWIQTSNVRLTDVTFRGNNNTNGGALFIDESAAKLRRVKFIGNYGGFTGAAIDVSESQVTLQSCLFASNIATVDGLDTPGSNVYIGDNKESNITETFVSCSRFLFCRNRFCGDFDIYDDSGTGRTNCLRRGKLGRIGHGACKVK